MQKANLVLRLGMTQPICKHSTVLKKAIMGSNTSCSPIKIPCLKNTDLIPSFFS